MVNFIHRDEDGEVIEVRFDYLGNLDMLHIPCYNTNSVDVKASDIFTILQKAGYGIVRPATAST